MKGRISQRDIARLAGVSPMTVSLALRGHPSISEATREKVRRIAARNHYRPDPALSALNAYRIQGRARKFQGVLAWLTCFSTAEGWREMIHANAYFSGAAERARELGYELDAFWLAEPGLSPKRALQILLSRGVQGIIVAPLPAAHGSLVFDWKPFSSVALGYSLRQPQLNVVMNHQSRNMKQTVHHLCALGYRRVGLALPSANNARVDQNYLSGYLIAQREAGGERLEPLLADVFETVVFLKWFRTEKPDAIIVSPAWVDRITEWLRSAGARVPQDVGLASASIPDGPTKVTGMNESPAMIGGMAVDAVVGMIHRQERGVPDRPWSLLAEGVWSPGKTARKWRAGKSGGKSRRGA